MAAVAAALLGPTPAVGALPPGDGASTRRGSLRAVLKVSGLRLGLGL